MTQTWHCVEAEANAFSLEGDACGVIATALPLLWIARPEQQEKCDCRKPAATIESGLIGTQLCSKDRQ